MIKRIILFSVCFMILHESFSQQFMHGAGTGVFFNSSPFIRPSVLTVVTYSPRVNFIETKSLSVSAGIPLSVGYGWTYNLKKYYTNNYNQSKNNSAFIVDIPVIINLNMGAGSTKQNEKRFGFFIGGGLAYQYGTYFLAQYDPYTGWYSKINKISLGPAGNMGIRLAVGKHQKNIEAKFSYMRSLKKDETSVLGITALFNF